MQKHLSRRQIAAFLTILAVIAIAIFAIAQLTARQSQDPALASVTLACDDGVPRFTASGAHGADDYLTGHLLTFDRFASEAGGYPGACEIHWQWRVSPADYTADTVRSWESNPGCPGCVGVGSSYDHLTGRGVTAVPEGAVARIDFVPRSL